MLKTQEKTINELRLQLFQAVSQQALKVEEVEKMEKWLNSDLSQDQNDINDTIKMFLKIEKASDELLDKEPFLTNPFSFHSSYITLSLRNRESIISDELVTHYKAVISELQTRLKIKDKEIKSSTEMNTYYKVQVGELNTKIDSLAETITQLKTENTDTKDRYDRMIKIMKDDFR